jgi:threonine synthase
LRCLIYLPEGYHTKRIEEITRLGAEIERVPGDYENAVEISRRAAAEHEMYDANPGGPNTSIQLHAYREIAYEIYDELRDAPTLIALSVSNGTTLAGIHGGFVSLYRRGKTSRIPRMVAGSSYSKNPIVQAFLKNHARCIDLSPEQIKESAVNEPLINWHSIDGDHALRSIRETRGWASNATDREMLSYSRLLREREGLNVLPASTAGLIALTEQHRKEPMQNDRYVVILTGRKS